MNITAQQLESRIEQESGINAIVEQDGESFVISGLVETEGEHQAVLDAARDAVGNEVELVDDIEVATVLPEVIDDMDLSVGEAGGFPGAAEGTEDDEALEAGDFTDQRILDNAEGAAGPTAAADIDQDFSEGEEVYVPPTDPPSDGAGEVIGGFRLTAMDDERVARSTIIGGSPDEAIREAVLRELREDAATTALEIDVEVYEGIVTLRGSVDDLLDAEAAEEVAARLPEVREVHEELDVRNT
jgi:osmotically-inducible protein OsmY